jgi:hypothetical protein
MIQTIQELKELAISHWKQFRTKMVKSLTPKELDERATSAAERSHSAMKEMYDKMIKEHNLNDLLATSAAELEILPMWILLPDERDEKAGLI